MNFFVFLWKKKIYLLFLLSCPFSYFPSLYNTGLSNISCASSRLLLLYTAVSTDIFTKDTRLSSPLLYAQQQQRYISKEIVYRSSSSSLFGYICDSWLLCYYYTIEKRSICSCPKEQENKKNKFGDPFCFLQRWRPTNGYIQQLFVFHYTACCIHIIFRFFFI